MYNSGGVNTVVMHFIWNMNLLVYISPTSCLESPQTYIDDPTQKQHIYYSIPKALGNLNGTKFLGVAAALDTL